MEKIPPYPFSRREVRAPLDAPGLERLHRCETRAGAPRSLPKAAKRWLERNRRMSTTPTASVGSAPPKWLRKMILDASSAERTLAMARDRVRRAPAGEAPLQAIALANEVGRTRTGAALISAQLCQREIDVLFRKESGE